MLQRQLDDRDCQFHTPFVANATPGVLDNHTSPKPPPQLHQSPSRSSPPKPFTRDHILQPSPPIPTTACRNPSLSLRIPPNDQNVTYTNFASSIGSEKEKGHPISQSVRTSRRGTPDPEKASNEHRSTRSLPSSNPISHNSTVIYEEDDETEGYSPKNHAVRILIYLSAISPLVTLCVTFYTLITGFLILLLSPLCLCTTQQPMRTHFTRFLVPPLHFQLGLIYSQHETAAEPLQSVAMLILTNVFSPFVAVGVSAAAWVAAAFWMFAKILGNPNANQGKDDEGNEGRAAVLGVRRFWEAWLIKSLR